MAYAKSHVCTSSLDVGTSQVGKLVPERRHSQPHISSAIISLPIGPEEAQGHPPQCTKKLLLSSDCVCLVSLVPRLVRRKASKKSLAGGE